jgi:hypothetical protein
MYWELDYKQKLRTPDEALMRRAPFVQDVEIAHMMTMGPARLRPLICFRKARRSRRFS